MPGAVVDDSERMNLRVKPEVKARLVRAAALRHTDLIDFLTRAALREADAVIEAAEHVTLSERDSLVVLDLLEKAQGKSLGRPFKLTAHQKAEAIRRREAGEETLAEIGRSYNISGATISRLPAP